MHNVKQSTLIFRSNLFSYTNLNHFRISMLIRIIRGVLIVHTNETITGIIGILRIYSLRWIWYMKNYWIIYVNMYRKIRFTRACFVTLLRSVFKFFKSFTFVCRKITFSRTLGYAENRKSLKKNGVILKDKVIICSNVLR